MCREQKEDRWIIKLKKLSKIIYLLLNQEKEYNVVTRLRNTTLKYKGRLRKTKNTKEDKKNAKKTLL